MYGEMVVVWVISGLLFVGLHYFPWWQLLGKCLGLPGRYTCGVLGLGLCYSGLLMWWALYRGVPWIILIAFWGVVVFGGGAVWGCYILDATLEERASAQDEQARTELLARRQGDEEK